MRTYLHLPLLIAFCRMLDLLEDFMALRSVPYARLDGGTTRPRRALDIKLVRSSLDALPCPELDNRLQFQQDQSPYKVFLISTKAGGLGTALVNVAVG
jgi:SWI/SNF-related matrix-associated actin-dependent regulator of chromatin subfamily A member 5